MPCLSNSKVLAVLIAAVMFGLASSAYATITGVNTDSGQPLYLSAGGNLPYMTILPSNGYVGVGTTAPDALFTVNTGASSDYESFAISASGSNLLLQNYITTTGASASRKALTQIASVPYSTDASNYGGILTFATTPAAGVLTERVRIDNNGNVGINTASPIGVLNVSGVWGQNVAPAQIMVSSSGTTTAVAGSGDRISERRSFVYRSMDNLRIPNGHRKRQFMHRHKRC